jgi:hypothetical protein
MEVRTVLMYQVSVIVDKKMLFTTCSWTHFKRMEDKRQYCLSSCLLDLQLSCSSVVANLDVKRTVSTTSHSLTNGRRGETTNNT